MSTLSLSENLDVLMKNVYSEAVVRRCPIKKGFLKSFKDFAKFTGKLLCQELCHWLVLEERISVEHVRKRHLNLNFVFWW